MWFLIHNAEILIYLNVKFIFLTGILFYFGKNKIKPIAEIGMLRRTL